MFVSPVDVAQILLSVLFLAIMIVACLWIVQPFILGFAWAGTVVIATGPVLLRLQKIMFGRRSLAVLVMTLLLVMVFIIPIALLVNSIVDGSGPLIKAISSGDMTLPDLAWLNTIPVIGAKLYAGWHNLLDMGGLRSWRKSALILAPPPPGSLGKRRISGALWCIVR